MTRKLLVGSCLLFAALAVLADGAPAAEPSTYLKLVSGASTQIDGKGAAEAKVFANQEKSVLLALVPGDLVYRVDRKGKNVVALRRPAIMVMPDKCRPMEGATERPITGHLYAESGSGFSFNDVTGRKIAVELPAGMLR